MELIIITGLSGSGKTSAIHTLEDMGFFCVDNLPILLLPGLVDLFERSEQTNTKLAVVMDLRGKGLLERYVEIFQEIRDGGITPEIIFLEATMEALLRRYEETRRAHPLSGERTLAEVIAWEEDQLAGLRQAADRVIDTSFFNIHQLRRYLNKLYRREDNNEKQLQVELISFSYAKGLPYHVDFMMDVRFLPNPYWEPSLKELDGRDNKVQTYIRTNTKENEILDKFYQLVEGMIAFYEKDDRAYFVLAVGCTGGKHRSVAVVCSLEERLSSLGYSPKVLHRDISIKKDSFSSRK